MKKENWYIERIVWLLAGLFSLLGLGLGTWVHPYFFLLNAVVGLNQIILAFTGFCPMTIFLHKLGVPSFAGNCSLPNSR